MYIILLLTFFRLLFFFFNNEVCLFSIKHFLLIEKEKVKKRFIRYEVGSGVNVHFWREWWCGDGILKEAFPELSRLAQYREALVVDYVRWNDGRTFIRAVQDWEADLPTDFLNLIYSTEIRRDEKDQISWQQKVNSLR